MMLNKAYTKHVTDMKMYDPQYSLYSNLKAVVENKIVKAPVCGDEGEESIAAAC